VESRGGGLLEREDDLAALRLVIAAAAGGEGALGIIDGPAGIGKTALLEALQELVEESPVRFLRARASELERPFAYGVVRQLVEAEVVRLTPEQRAVLLDGAAAPAGSVLGVGAGAASDASFGVLHGLYWVLLGLAREAPVVLSVDDVHWADKPSLRFLAYVAARLDGSGIGLLLAMRTAEPGARDELLDDLREMPGALVVRPAPLSVAAVAAVVRGASMPGADDRDVCRACHQASAGNPFYLRELIRAVGLERVAPTPEEVQLVADVWPGSIARHLLRRVARAGEGARELARAMAVLGDGCDLRHAARLAGTAAPGTIARALLEMEVLATEQPVCFLHPVVRRAIYADLTSDERELLHLRAARLLVDVGGDHERVAAHLLGVPPAAIDWVLRALRAAAEQALGRGSPDASVVYLRRALLECPVDAALGSEVLRDLGVAEEHLADIAAVGHLRQAHAGCVDARGRARIALDLARALQTRGLEPDAATVVRRALTESESIDDPALVHRLQAALVGMASVDARVVGPDAVELYGRLRSEVPDGTAGSVVLALAAAGAVWSGAPACDGAETAEEAIARGLLETDEWDAIGACIRALILSERYDAAGRHLRVLRAAVQRRGHARGIALTGQLEANRAERLGSLVEAESSGRMALEIVRQRGLAVGGLSWIECTLVDTLVERGELAEAEAVLEHMPTGTWPPHQGCASALAARGRLRLAQGRPAEALADLLDVGRRYRAWPGFQFNGPAPSHWRSSAALASQRLGFVEDARRLAFEEVDHARRFGAPRALGIALRAAGIVAGDGRTLELLNESVDVLRDSPALLERAHSSAALGMTLRRGGHRVDAREPLRQALELARDCGAVPLAGFTRDELIAAGARPRRDAATGLGALTDAERRVAVRAAGGKTNREIAQELFLSPKTIEMHLSRAYRKVGVASRGELTRVLFPPEH